VEPDVRGLREMGTPAMIMSGNPDEGVLFGGVRPAPLPPGRGVLVRRRTGNRLVQVARSAQGTYGTASGGGFDGQPEGVR
jgi:hypothetical protein